MQQNVYNKLNTTYLKCPGSKVAPIQDEYNPTLFASNVNIDNIPKSAQTELTHRDLTVYQTCINKVYNFSEGTDNMQTLLIDISNSYVPILPPNGIMYKAIKDSEIILDLSNALLEAYDASYSRLTERIKTNKKTFNTYLTNNERITSSLSSMTSPGGAVYTNHLDLTTMSTDINTLITSTLKNLGTITLRNIYMKFINTKENINDVYSNLDDNLSFIKYYRDLYVKTKNIYNNYKIDNTTYNTEINDFINYIKNNNNLKKYLNKNTTLKTTHNNVLSILNNLKTIKTNYNNNIVNCDSYTNRNKNLNNAFINCYNDTHIDLAKKRYEIDTNDLKSAKQNNQNKKTITNKQNTRQSSLDCYNNLSVSFARYNSNWNKTSPTDEENKGIGIYNNYFTPETVTMKDFDWKDQKKENSNFNNRHNTVLKKCNSEIKNKCNMTGKVIISNAYNYIKNNTHSTACTIKNSSLTSFGPTAQQLLPICNNIITNIKSLLITVGVEENSYLYKNPDEDPYNNDTTFNKLFDDIRSYITKIKNFIVKLNSSISYFTQTVEPKIKEYINNNCTSNNEIVITYFDYNNNIFKGPYNISLQHSVIFTDKLNYMFMSRELPVKNVNGVYLNLYNSICEDIIEANRIKDLFNALLIRFNIKYNDYSNNLIVVYDQAVASYNTKINTAIGSFNNCAYLKTCDRPESNPPSKNKMAYTFIRSNTVPDDKLPLFNYVTDNGVTVNGAAIKSKINTLLNSQVIGSYSPKKKYFNYVSKNTNISTNIQEGMENFKRNEILGYDKNNNYSFIEGMCSSQSVYNENPENNLVNTVSDLNNVSFYSKFITNVKRTEDLSQNLMNLQNNLQIDMHYLLKYNAQIDLLKYMIITCCVALIGSVLFHSGLFSSTFYTTYLIIVFSIGFLAIIYKYFDIFGRSKLNFNEKDYDMLKPPVITSDISGQSLTLSDLSELPSICDIEKETRGIDNY